MKIPILLDTDIGDDIDDALALSLIVQSPEFDLRGVTTVFGNAPRRAQLAQKLLGAWNKSEIPVAAGVSKPLLTPPDARIGSQMEWLGDAEIEKPFPHALDFIVSQFDLEAEPDLENPLVIACIGPLTNIALAIVRLPELVSRARLVIMGGDWGGGTAEWNIKWDVEAAAIVFNSGIAIDMVGLDVTWQCQLDDTHVAQFAKRQSEGARALSTLIKLWLDETKNPITLHDPLTVMTLVSDVVRFEDKRIEVALSGPDRGKTLVVAGEPNCRVAATVDAQRAKSEFMQRILA